MLNELLVIERGARQGKIEMVQPHPDINYVRQMPTLKVSLGQRGNVSSIGIIPDSVTPWTIRDGKHNSFPFVQQPKIPLLTIPRESELINLAVDKKKESNERREALKKLTENAVLNIDSVKNWPGPKMNNRLWDRLEQLSFIEGQNNCVVWATFERFLRTCDVNVGGNSIILFTDLLKMLIENFRHSAQDDWLEIAVSLLVGKEDKNKKHRICDVALLFEAEETQFSSIFDPRLIMPVSDALNRFNSDNEKNDVKKICALTGENCSLHSGNFPQPNLKGIGPTYIFSKNKEIPANDRYSRFATDAMPLGRDVATKLGGAFLAITASERENITWRKIPGEALKQTDLFVAFVEGAIDAPIAESFAEEDFSEEEITNSENDIANSVAIFEKHTERMIETIRAKINSNLSETYVRLCVFRKVDPANRKAVYTQTLSVNNFDLAAKNWINGEKNVPPWLTLPIIQKGQKKLFKGQPPHMAPLGFISFSKQMYVRFGTERQEIPGIPASEAFRFFLESPDKHKLSLKLLRLVLSRRTSLLRGVAHMEHTPRSWRRRNDTINKFKYVLMLNRESLKTTSVLGVLLFKLGRKGEEYMNETAFKLGQLLASADIVHAGYCADIRGGDIPPSLLGNQVFAMAQSSPAKALSVLCRRWKPYDGWAKKTARDTNRIDVLIASKQKSEKERGWDIKKALRHAREMGNLADQLTLKLEGCRASDEFRAELLLGYLAGLPKAKRVEPDTQTIDVNKEEKE